MGSAGGDWWGLGSFSGIRGASRVCVGLERDQGASGF